MPPNPPSPVAASDEPVAAWLDGPSRGRLHGWALDRTRPGRRLTVEIESDNGVRLLALADRYRADLHQSGLGDGYHGFSVPLSRLGGARTVRVACAESRVEIGSADLTHHSRMTSGAPYRFERGTYTLFIDSIERGQLEGWAADAAWPGVRRVLRLSRDARLIAQQRATLFRADSVDAQRDGLHGFSLAWSPEPIEEALVLEDLEAGLAFHIRL